MTEAQGVELIAMVQACLFVLYTIFFAGLTVVALNRFIVVLVFAGLVSLASVEGADSDFSINPLEQPPDEFSPWQEEASVGQFFQRQALVIRFVEQHIGAGRQYNDGYGNTWKHPLLVENINGDLDLGTLESNTGAIKTLLAGPTSIVHVQPGDIQAGTPTELNSVPTVDALKAIRVGPDISPLDAMIHHSTFTQNGLLPMPTTTIGGVAFPVSFNLNTLGAWPAYIRNAFLWAELAIFGFLIFMFTRKGLVA